MTATPILQHSAPPVVSYLELAGLLSAVGWARRHTRDVLSAWGIERNAETVELLVSELVTNAVRHARVPDGAVTYLDLAEVRRISLTLRLRRDRVSVEIWDSDPQPPAMREQSLDAEGGRGLFLVATLSKEWGYYHPPTGGKVVWCVVPLPSSGTTADARGTPRLPKRQPSTMPVPKAEVVNDPSILQQVIDGLHRME
ncbi:ATP-binding protein [Carbonactinospora thermoautotrophica]|uniref:ATP-binding protein n=1 Tax=Carbonactinospora thermoautotrophica TaxID=1469144 RepID=UPI001FCFF5F7|nr:ATP-binding protein [Carbonactinospora thermoautotrophica]